LIRISRPGSIIGFSAPHMENDEKTNELTNDGLLEVLNKSAENLEGNTGSLRKIESILSSIPGVLLGRLLGILLGMFLGLLLP